MYAKNVVVSAVALGAILAASQIQAAVITWQAPVTIANNVAQVSTLGTTDRAYYFAPDSTGSTTVNGVTFNTFDVGYNTYPASVTVGSTTLSSSVANTQLYYRDRTTTSDPYASLDANYKQLCRYSATAYGNFPSAPFTIAGIPVLTLNNLTVGKEYLFQLWLNLSPAVPANTATGAVLTNGVSESTLVYQNTSMQIGGLGQYVIGTFTANSTSEAFTWTRQQYNFSNAMDAFQLRVIPEPGTLVLVATGLLGLSCRAWRKRKSA